MAQESTTSQLTLKVNRYINKLKSSNLPIEEAFVFGSQVKGTAHKWSDIDVAIVSPEFKSRFEAFDYLWGLRDREDVLNGIEPIGYNPMDFHDSDPLVYEIKHTGVKII